MGYLDRAKFAAFGCMAVVAAAIVRYLAGDAYPFVFGVFRRAFGHCAMFHLMVVRRSTVFRSNQRYLHILDRAQCRRRSRVFPVRSKQPNLQMPWPKSSPGPNFPVLGTWIFWLEIGRRPGRRCFDRILQGDNSFSARRFRADIVRNLVFAGRRFPDRNCLAHAENDVFRGRH